MLRSSVLLPLLLSVLGLGGCAGSALEQTLSADPRLTTAEPTPPTRTPEPFLVPGFASPTPEPSPLASPSPTTSPDNPFSNSPSPSPASTPGPAAPTASPTVPPNTVPTLSPNPPQTFGDLEQAPPELRGAIADLAALGVLNPQSNPQPKVGPKPETGTTAGTVFAPNEPVSRREYGRWLMLANNLFNRDRPARQLRLALTNSNPVFIDVPRTDPDFPVLQGLAEAGIVPSALSGDSSVVNFKPDSPLTREEMVLWKVPLDTAQALPKPNLEAVREAWGFQDSGKIAPRALGAVLADFQNGDQSMIRRAFGYTTLLQPQKPVTRAEAAAALWYFGSQNQGQSAADLRRR